MEKHCSKSKIMWGNTVAIDNISKKNYKAKFSTSLIVKKIKLIKNFEK